MPEKKIKVLIIDDDTVDRLTIKRALKLTGFNADVFTATDIETGTSLALEEKFDCIFIDYNLPGSNGFDFLENYKGRNGQAPVIMVTSKGDEQIAAEAIKKGACDYIPKNMITAESISAILCSAFKIKCKGNISSENECKQKEFHNNNLEMIIADTPLIIFALNQNGIFNLFKGKGIEKFQITMSDVLGKSIFEVGNNLPVQLKDYKNALLGNSYNTSVEMMDGFYEVYYIPVKDAKNNLTGVNGVVMDITTMKKNEQELKNSLLIAEEAQNVKELFLANMSHEIRTPIHGIMNLTDILLKTPVTADQLTFLDAIKKSADNLLVIINDILDISKIEAQKMTFENSQFKLKETIQSVIELFKPKAEEKNIRLISNYDEALPQFINGDSVRLCQVINNLISNAIKFTHEGEVRLDICNEEKNEKHCLISFKVSDTGIGISQHKLNSIFDSFSQASDDITRKYGGTGLGLSISKKLVELQGGMISVESKLNEGSTFIFRMSFENAGTGIEATVNPANNNANILFNKELRLLVVEDNDINRFVINTMMKDWGFKMDNATNGSDAIDLLEQNDYDVILMDIEMPGLNGYRTAEHIRQNLPAPKNAVPILAMTAHAKTSEKEKCLKAGMNDYVSKPFDASELKNKIILLSSTTSFSNNGNTENVSISPAIERCTNLTFLKQLAENNDAFFKDFICLFLQNAPITIRDLENALEKKDWANVHQAAHKIKPSLSYLGMKEIHQAAITIEENAKNQTNLDSVPELINKIKATCNKAFAELEQELKELSVS